MMSRCLLVQHQLILRRRGRCGIVALATMLLAYLAIVGPPGTAAAAEPGFTDLFNGKDLSGWVIESHVDSETHEDGRPVWSVQNGEIACDGLGFGFLRYAAAPFADCTLRLEFQLLEHGRRVCNSGIGIRTCVFDRRRSPATRASIRGYELQLLDDSGEPVSEHSSGSLYRYVPPRTNAMNAAGEWNALEVTMLGPRIRVTLNDRLIQDVDQMDVPMIRSKPLSGFIALQNHGGQARFRNIRVRPEEPTIPEAADLEAQAAILGSRNPSIGIRGVLRFAVEAAGRGWKPQEVEAALELARSMQVVDPAHEDFGNFRWRLGDDRVTDANAADFAGQLLGVLRLEDEGRLVPRPGGSRLTLRGRELLETMARDAMTVFLQRQVKPGHTNIRLMRIWNLMALGDLVGPDAVRKGESAWDEWLAFTRTHGLTEYLCPTYLGVSLDSLALIADHAPAMENRIEADTVLAYVWRSAAAHWSAAAQRLSGPHARDYDYLYGRGYADEHFLDTGWLTVKPRPEGAGWLPDAPRDSLEVFRSACRSVPYGGAATDIIETQPRFVVERTGTQSWQRITNHVGRTVAIGVAGEGRGPEDKTLLITMPPLVNGSSSVPSELSRTPNVTLVFDGRRDPYGLAPVRNAGTGHSTSRHLHPYLISSQQGPRVTAAWYLDPARRVFSLDPSTLTCLEAHLLLPSGCSVWSADMPLASGAELPSEAVLFLRGGDGVVAGIRTLAPADPHLRPRALRLVADGGSQPVQRLTATFSEGVPHRGALLALDIEVREGLDDDAFAAFRREFSARDVVAHLDGTRFTVSGSLPLELDLGEPEGRPSRVLFEPILPEDGLLVIDGTEIGREVIDRAMPE